MVKRNPFEKMIFFNQDNVNYCLTAHVKYSEVHAKCAIIANIACRCKNGLNNLTRLAFKQEIKQVIRTAINLLNYHVTIKNRFLYKYTQWFIPFNGSNIALFFAIQILDLVAPKQNNNATKSIK